MLKTSLMLTLALVSSPLVAQAEGPLKSFTYLSLGMSFEALSGQGAGCDALADSPGFKGSLELGVASTICPTAETFAMATLIDKKIATVAVNWVSWDAQQLTVPNKTVSQIPGDLRKKYGIPVATIPYESQFGNRDADRFCKDKGECRIHFWKTDKPARVASLVYAQVQDAEVPLIFHLADLEAERRINQLKNR